MVKADDKVQYEEDGKMVDEKYTHFEELRKRVEQLQENMDEIARILIENGLKRTEEISAPYFDTDKLYEDLEEQTDVQRRED